VKGFDLQDHTDLGCETRAAGGAEYAHFEAISDGSEPNQPFVGGAPGRGMLRPGGHARRVFY